MSFKASNLINNNKSITPREKTAMTTNLDRPSSFNGGDHDHGFGLQGDPTATGTTKTGLIFGDKDEECNSSNHATMFGFRIAPSSFGFGCNNILSRGTAFILFLIAMVTLTGSKMMNVGVGGGISNINSNINSSKQVAVITVGGGPVPVDRELSSDRTLVQVQNTVIEYEFTEFGIGICTDSNNNDFDYVTFAVTGESVEESVEACRAQCVECPGQLADRKLLGFSYLKVPGYFEVCDCHLEKGLDFGADGLCDFGQFGGSIAIYDQNPGTGPICTTSVVGAPIEKCFKVVDDEDLECPTSAPTKEPTATPSKAPTLSPSKAPTATAPPSTEPTSAPTNSKSAKARSGKAVKTNAANVGTTLQAQEMKSRGSYAYASITPLVEFTLVSMVALGALLY